jgi:hypothetical protein
MLGAGERFKHDGRSNFRLNPPGGIVRWYRSEHPEVQPAG